MSKYRSKPRDDLGARKGTTAAAVNKVMTTKWQSVGEIQKKLKVRKQAVIRRLYHGVEKGIYDHESTVRFKLKRQRKKT